MSPLPPVSPNPSFPFCSADGFQASNAEQQSGAGISVSPPPALASPRPLPYVPRPLPPHVPPGPADFAPSPLRFSLQSDSYSDSHPNVRPDPRAGRPVPRGLPPGRSPELAAVSVALA